MVAIETFDAAGLEELFGRTDRLGVLSVYVDANPAHDPQLQAAAIDLRNRRRELERRLDEDPASDRARQVAAAVQRLWPRLEGLASPTISGRTRIGFAGLGEGWLMQLESAMQMPASRLVLDDGPFIHPLLELLDEGRTAGVLIVSADGAQLSEWRLGTLDHVRWVEHEYSQASHERAGHIGGGPQGQFNTPMREQRQARERERMRRFVQEVATVSETLAHERGWERMFVSGGERWTESVISCFSQSFRDRVFSDSRNLARLDEMALTEMVTDLMHQQNGERKNQLLDRVRQAARTGAAAVGLPEVTAALNAGRAEHLVYDPQVRYRGTVSADGRLYASEQIPPGSQLGVSEPRLTERLAARAVDIRARVSPISGAARDGLDDADGVAALLRW